MEEYQIKQKLNQQKLLKVFDYEKYKILGITPKKIAYNGIIEEFNKKLRIK